MTGAARVLVYSRQGCHLCEVALETASRVCVDLGVGLEVVDVDTDPGLQHEYGEQVPVTLVDGRRHDFFRVDEQRLRRALAGPSSGRSSGPSSGPPRV